MSDYYEMFIRQRRSLNALSVGLIVFFVASGTYDQLRFPMVGIRLEDEKVAITILWIGLLYFLYRFYISAAAAKHEYELQRSRALWRHPKYKQWKSEFAGRQGELYVEKLLFRRFLNPGGNASYQEILEIPRHKKHLGRDRHHRDAWKQVPYRQMFWPELISDLKAIRQTGFSEVVLPLVLAYSAIGLGLYRLFAFL